MDVIFKNSGATKYGTLSSDMGADVDAYSFTIRALIADTVDFELSDLAPQREMNQEYYYGMRPSLNSDTDEEITGDPPIDDDATNTSRSTVVSTDVRDTVLSIMPSLMRIFAGSEHAVEFEANKPDDDDMAKQATDYVRMIFWKKNAGFMLLYSMFWDALVNRIGIATWGTTTHTERTQKVYDRLTVDQLKFILSETELDPQVEMYTRDPDMPGQEPTASNVKISFERPSPKTWVDGVPPEDFRISRRAKSVKTADIVGYRASKRISELVEMDYDYDEVLEYAGVSDPYSSDRWIRQPGSDTFYPLDDLVEYGCYWVRVDKDGDGINELRLIHTIGDDFHIISDEIVEEPKIAIICSDPVPHTAIGRSAAELVLDIQRIKTNLIRGGLDSLAQSIFPRSVFNELLTNTDDMLSDDIGQPIRTRANPAEAVYSFTHTYVGDKAFESADYLDKTRVSRTGISDASKGLDPKAFQSTNLSGIDAIVSGAQERIELIARIFAETGIKDMYEGLLKEVVDHPNREETIKLRGAWVPVNPSNYDPYMRCEVNPMLGKGSDSTRLSVLQWIATAQQGVVEKYGLGNGIVGVQEMRNTQVDILGLVNFKNANRYFREVSPQQAQAMEQAPKTPDAQTLLAQSQMEEVKRKTVDSTVKAHQQVVKQTADNAFRYEKLHTDSYVALVTALKDGLLAAGQPEDEVLHLSPGGTNG